MKQGQTLRQTTRQKADFRLIAATQLLQKGALSLRQLIQDELSANPALELATDLLCPTCGSPLRNGTCRICDLLRYLGSGETDGGGDGSLSPLPSYTQDDRSLGSGDFADVASPIDLGEHLRTQIRTLISAEDYDLADYIIANIDDRGLLECDLAEIAFDLRVSEQHVADVISVIQSMDPVGVGSRTPPDALLAQLKYLAQEGEIDPWAQKIIESCWEDLAYQRYSRIARALGCTLDDVRCSVEYIKENLNPYPASAFKTPAPETAAQSIRWIDVIIHGGTEGYRVEIVEPFETELRVSETFLRLRKAFAGAGKNTARPSASLESLRRACFFLACLKMRKKTLQEVAECVVNLQQGYLDTGLEEHLRPLTRAKVAAQLGKHESTVSRAVAEKYVLLPSRQLIPFDRFFTPGAGPKSIIRELIQREVRGRPLTDKQIARILASRGYTLARRTIAKYRLALQIPSSSQRRSH